MLAPIAAFLGFAMLIVLAGILLARTTDRIAEDTGLGHHLGGLVLLASATSLPEMTVAYNAVRQGAVDLTMGDVLGSSLVNLLILGVLDLVTRTGGRMLSRNAAAHALSATAALLLTALVLLFLLLDLRWTLGPFGLGSLTIAAVYLAALRLVYFDQRVARAAEAAPPRVRRTPWKAIAGYALGAVTILATGPHLVRAANEVAVTTGMGPTFFGTLFVALVTSLPEIVTTVAALRLGRHDMAIANVFGSNAFNMLIPVVADMAGSEPVFAQASDVHVITAAAVLIVTAVAIMSLLYRAERRLWLVEPDALLVVLLVIAALVLVYVRSH